ncbi:cytochrome P450 [Nocardiopsis sp. MG754419]|uniref:cytochrome P450 n=1 Tax=Nocardiopsis sp. MG754419 TaxID=2259865 RepID=UPI0020137B7F|nr:cytochrome P450 [Nocardiopsis sp. MG754419]
MFSPEYHADPHTTHRHLADEHGGVHPAEIVPGVHAWIVTDYATITAWCRDPYTFRRDSRLWSDWKEGRIPDDSPVAAMMAHRPNLLYADGEEHTRLKRAVVDSLGRVPESRVGDVTRRHADALIDAFVERGDADLVAEYTRLLPLMVLSDLFGFSRDIAERVLTSISELWDGVDVLRANQEYERALSDAISAKHATPGEDVTTWLLHHRAGLSDEEMLHQMVVTFGAGAEPTANLIASTVHTLLTDPDAGSALNGTRVGVAELVDQVLWREPPITNYPVLYPTTDVPIEHGRVIKAGEPVLLGYAAAHHAMVGAAEDIEQHNRAHLSFGVGPHRCPARGFGQAIAEVAVQSLIRRLPRLRASEPTPQWRVSPFARALSTLPVTFTPGLSKGTPSWQHSDPSSSPRTSTDSPPASASTEPSSRWRSLVAWLFGR